MGNSNEWKGKQIVGAFGAFTQQFGELDDHSRVVLEIILEEIHGDRKRLPISRPQGQARSDGPDNIPCGREDLSDENP